MKMRFALATALLAVPVGLGACGSDSTAGLDCRTAVQQAWALYESGSTASDQEKIDGERRALFACPTWLEYETEMLAANSSWSMDVAGTCRAYDPESESAVCQAATSGDSGDPTDTGAVPEVDTPPAPSETLSQQNARDQAESYLRTSAFSRKGLINQLKYEGYSQADATYAVDAVRPNWKEQAALKAQQYLDTMSFSRQRLVEQLKYEGFTDEQARYGVSKTGL